jgi:hypothetical protein
MPLGAAIPWIVGLGGAALGAMGASGKQGSTQSNATSTSTSMPIEPGYMGAFRQQGMGNLTDFLGQMMQGPYGSQQVSQGIQNIQVGGNAATGQTLQNLAKFGRLNSGSADTAMTGIGANTASGVSSWMNQVPLLNYQAKSSAVSPLLNTWANWAGKAPVGQINVGNQQQTSTDQGAPFWSNFASNLGGMAASGGFDGLFKKSPTPDSINPWSPATLPSTDIFSPGMGDANYANSMYGSINLPSWTPPPYQP